MTKARMVSVTAQVCLVSGERRVTLGPDAFEDHETDEAALAEAQSVFEEMLDVPYRGLRISAIQPITTEE